MKTEIVELQTPVNKIVVFTVPLGDHVGIVNCTGCGWNEDGINRKRVYTHAGECRVTRRRVQ